MRRLARMRGGAHDRGAMAVLIAILFPVVLLGIGAFVVDVGSWYAERAQTQNGADAGVMAVAVSCANGACDTGRAGPYAPGNTTGNLGTSSVVQAGYPCGSSSTNDLPACPSGTENGTTCPKARSANYVDVRVQTDKPVRPILGSVLGGTAHTIGACAQASWGPPSGLGNGSALTMSACEWSKDTADGTVFGHVPAYNSDGTPNYNYVQNVPTGLPSYLDTLTARRSDPDYDTVAGDPTTNYYVSSKPTIKDPHSTPRLYRYPDTATPIPARVAGSETVLTTHGFGNTCKAGDAGSTAPGQFGWLSNTACTVVIDGSTYGGAPGASSAPCETAFTASRSTGQPIFLPVYNAVTLSGNNTQYTLLGYAAFVVTGWDMTNASAGNWSVKKAPSLVTSADSSVPAGSANYCGTAYTGSNSDQCVYGFFTQKLIPPDQQAQSDPNAPPPKNLGATAAYLTG